jgi:hypothetical protein
VIRIHGGINRNRRSSCWPREEDLTEQRASFGDNKVTPQSTQTQRRERGVTLKKEDGVPMSLSYFHDMEAGKRNPTNDP